MTSAAVLAAAEAFVHSGVRTARSLIFVGFAAVSVPAPETPASRVTPPVTPSVKAMPPAPSNVPGPGYGVTDILYGPSERPQQQSGLIGPVRLLDPRVQLNG